MSAGAVKGPPKPSPTREAAITRLRGWRAAATLVSATYVRHLDRDGVVFIAVNGVIGAFSEKTLRVSDEGGVLMAIMVGAEFYDGPITAIDVADDFKIESEAVQIKLTNGDNILVSPRKPGKRKIPKAAAKMIDHELTGETDE